ncbi:hypothetical protein UFOVP597_49 [uncultured Caudovirales phage]|uniref:Uncharacterized protein n=1 Tax=uncultured Caudovirales phage TaxID=2100421 RepID=A0A6J5N1A5_9CAUD|nr:hypothetical protein UFOVP597_49 [uncultured Caudovirales phage]
MAKKITQYPPSGGNPDVGSLIDISELIGSVYTSKSLTLQQLLDYLTANLDIGNVQVFKNTTGGTILKGTPCEIYSAQTLIPLVSTLNDSFENGLSKIYIATENILNNATGSFIESGIFQYDTSAFPVGSKVFIDWSDFSLTLDGTQEDQVFIGIVITQNIAGKIFASPTRNPQLIKGVSGQVPLFMGERKINGNTHFTYIDNAGTEVGFRFSDNSNNLTQVGVTYINIESEGIASNSVLRLANWANNSNKGIVSFRKSRGSKASPSKVLINDVLGTLIFAGQTDKTIDAGLVISSGMTTGEIIIRALNNFVKNYDSFGYETFAQGLTQFEIWLQGSDQTIAGDLTPPNTKVFSVDGDGKVSFKTYTFPINAGTNGQVLSIISAGQLGWTTPSSPAVALSYKHIAIGNASNILSSSQYFSYDNGFLNVGTSGGSAKIQTQLVSDTNYPMLILSRFKISGTYVILDDIIGSLSTNTMVAELDILRVIATESHSPSNAGQDVVLYSIGNGTLVQKEVLRIGQDGRLKVSNAYKLPLTDGTNGQYLTTDGFGNITWSSGSGSTDHKWNLKPAEVFRGVSFNNNSTTLVLSGGIVNSTTASTSAKNVSGSSFINKVIGLGFTASVVSTGRYTGIRGSALLWFMGGGFRYTCSFNISDTAYGSGCRQFYGLGGQTADLGYTDTILVGSLLNVIGVGSDSADANLQIFHNDGSGSCTKIDLGASFPANRTAGTAQTTIYEVQFLNEPAQTNVHYRIANKETGAVVTGILSTDLPLSTQGLNFFASRTMGSPLTGSGQFILTGNFGVYSTN